MGNKDSQENLPVPAEDLLTLQDTRNLKRVEYKGFRGNNGEVVYRIQGKKVMFSAIQSALEATSSINAAESIVKAICNTEGIDWRKPSFFKEYEFYDLTTPLGYRHRTEYPIPGEDPIQILKLALVPSGKEGLHVESFTRVGLDGKPLINPTPGDQL